MLRRAHRGQRPQHHGVDQAEDGGICADAESERNDRAREESRAAAQGARSVNEILPQVGEPSRALDVAQLFVNLRGATEFQTRAAAGLFGLDALRDVILRDAVDVILDFRFEAPILRIHSAVLMICSTAPASRSQLAVSASSRLRPARVSE